MSTPTSGVLRRPLALGALALAQLALVAVGVAPQLSARTTGETYLIRTAPVDPIDPFRGAYVELTYPGLTREDDAPRGTVHVELLEDGALVRPGRWLTSRPDAGPYLICRSDGWQARCGIESLFVPQDRARALERDLADGGVAEIRVDSRGNAAVVDVRAG